MQSCDVGYVGVSMSGREWTRTRSSAISTSGSGRCLLSSQITSQYPHMVRNHGKHQHTEESWTSDKNRRRGQLWNWVFHGIFSSSSSPGNDEWSLHSPPTRLTSVFNWEITWLFQGQWGTYSKTWFYYGILLYPIANKYRTSWRYLGIHDCSDKNPLKGGF